LTGGAGPLTIEVAESPSREIPRTATWESRSDGAARGWDAIGEGSVRVTENERRAADSLRASDLVLRGVGVVGLIAVALVLLLVLYPT
jgi:hypothetical protein